MARPKLDNPRDCQIRVRVTKRELAVLRREARQSRRPFARWVRYTLGLGDKP